MTSSEEFYSYPLLTRMFLMLVILAVGTVIIIPVFTLIVWCFFGKEELGVYGAFTLNWFYDAIVNNEFRNGLLNSIASALGITVVSVFMAALIDFSIQLTGRVIRVICQSFSLLVVLSPIIIYGLSLNVMIRPIIGEFAAYIIGCITYYFFFSLTLFLVISDERRMLYSHAASISGLSFFKSFFFVDAYIRRQAVVFVSVIIFMLSFDETALSLSVGGGEFSVIPRMFWHLLDYGTTPAMAAMVLMASIINLIVMGLLMFLYKKISKR